MKAEKSKFRPLITLISLLIVLISVSSFVAYNYHNTFKESQIFQWEQQLLSTLKISSANLETYITKHSDNLINISYNPIIKSKDFYSDPTVTDSLYCPIRTLYEVSKEEVEALLLIDSTGVIIKRFSNWGNQYFKTGIICCNTIDNELNLNEGQVYISDVFINKKGAQSINISCPIYNQSNRIAFIRWMIRTDSLSRRLIENAKIGTNGYMWCLDNYNNIIFHPNDSLIGKQIYAKNTTECEIFGAFNNNSTSEKWINETKEFYKQILTRQEYFGKTIDPSNGEFNLSAFTKVSIGNKEWTLLVNLPYSEISDPIKKEARRTLALLVLISIAILLISSMFYIIQKKKIQLEIEKKYLTEIAETAEELKEERSKRVHAVIAGQESERKRISRELHDGLGQMLLAIKVKLEGFTNSSSENNSDKIRDIKEISVKTIEEVKRISDNLMPVILDELDIVFSLKNLCEEFQSTYDIKIDFVSYGVSEKLDSDFKTNIYRIAQEALNNLCKHSQATEANIQLLGNEEQLTLIVSDNGIGFSEKDIDNTKSNGLHNMKDRASILKGEIRIESKKGYGTEINLKIPLKGD